MAGSQTPERYDAVIVGARAAGAANALELVRGGARVLLVDRERQIGDTLSTHALMRPAVLLLEAWGLLGPLLRAGTPVVASTEFVYGDERIVVPLKAEGPVPGLVAPRRWLLDPMLAEAAAKSGAEVRLGTAFDGVVRDGSGRVSGLRLRDASGRGYEVRSDLVIGADGRTSAVAASVGAQTLRSSDRRASTVYSYIPGLVNRGYRWYFAEGLQAGLIPTNDGLHCLFVSCPPAEFAARFGRDTLGGIRDAFAGIDPEVADHLAATGLAWRPRRFAGAPGHLRACAGPGWALVGDAGYFKDPATAHGITDAFLDAHRLSRAVLSGVDLSAYQAERDRHAGAFFEITQEIAGLDWTLDRVKVLHKALSRAIQSEAEALLPEARDRAA